MSSEDEETSAPPSWYAKQQKQFQDDMKNFDLEDCAGCKWIGGSAMMGAGVYVGYVGYNRAKRAGSRYGFIPSSIAASIMVLLGVARLTGYNPFSSSGKPVGIDALDNMVERISKSQTLADLRKKQEEMAQKRKERLEQMQEKKPAAEQMEQQEKRKGT